MQFFAKISILFIFIVADAYARGETFPSLYKEPKGEYQISIEDWSRVTGNKTFFDAKKRLLIEGKKSSQKAFFIEDIPFAIFQDQFLPLKQGLLKKQNAYFLPVSIYYNYLIDFVDAGKKEKISSELLKYISLKNTAVIIPSPKESVPVKKTVEKAKNTPAIACSREKPVKRIFLDPGHGGNDLGATFAGIYEKDIVLAVAELIAKNLKNEKFEVTFSRTKDVFLPLDIRSQIAKEWKADAFISIHMNSAKAQEAHGTETYILNSEATDAEARKLALSENTIVQEVKMKQSPLKDILWDMEQTAFLQYSAYLASNIQKSIITGEQDLKNRGVRQAPFFVLSRAAMPAVLLELGYISNSSDRKFMTIKKNQEHLAKMISNGIKLYAQTCITR